MATRGDGPARVAGVVLAAGLSTRLGRPKQLLDVCGEPLVRRITRIALASSLDTVTVVTGNAAGTIMPLLDDLGVVIAFNSDFASGQASSIKAGLRAIPADADAALILLVDQPTITPEILNRVIEFFRHKRSAVVQARYTGGVTGHPVLFSRKLFPELMTVTGDEGGRTVVRDHRGSVRYVDFDCEPPHDIDTDADYELMLATLQPL